MDKNEIMPKIKEFLMSELGVEEEILEFNTQLFGECEVGLDSIDSLMIISFVDDEFGVNMTGVARENFFSIETIADYIVANA